MYLQVVRVYTVEIIELGDEQYYEKPEERKIKATPYLICMLGK